MLKALLSTVLFLASNGAMKPSFANPALDFPVQGNSLIVNINHSGQTSNASALNGRDIFLVRLIADKHHQNANPVQFEVVAVTDTREVTRLDRNHDGVVEAAEIAASHLALLRHSKEGTMTVTPLAQAHIKEIRVKGNEVILISEAEEIFKTTRLVFF